MAVSENTGAAAETLTGGGTEDALNTAITAAGTYQLGVDLSNMANGDEVVLRVYVKLRSASTSKLLWEQPYKNAQGDDPVKFSPPIPSPFDFQAKAEKVNSGTMNIDWSVYEY